jgi:hypothetical protein
MLAKLKRQIQDYLGHSEYHIRLEFKGFIPGPALTEIRKFSAYASGRLTAIAI